MNENPSFDCITGKHMFAEMLDKDVVALSWCMWCGGGVSDPDKIADDGTPIGFTPTISVRIPADWHRRRDLGSLP
jgi:hypothetical protein